VDNATLQTPTERRNNAAHKLDEARTLLMAAMRDLDGLASEAYFATSGSVAAADDAMAALAKVERESLSFGSETLTRLDDSPSDYEGDC
jgi:hypothetical protein